MARKHDVSHNSPVVMTLVWSPKDSDFIRTRAGLLTARKCTTSTKHLKNLKYLVLK